MPREKNLCGKRRPLENPYEIWEAPGWEWRVVKKYQTPSKEKANRFARWMVYTKSPFTYDSFEGPADSYVRDIRRGGRRTFVDRSIGGADVAQSTD